MLLLREVSSREVDEVGNVSSEVDCCCYGVAFFITTFCVADFIPLWYTIITTVNLLSTACTFWFILLLFSSEEVVGPIPTLLTVDLEELAFFDFAEKDTTTTTTKMAIAKIAASGKNNDRNGSDRLRLSPHIM